MPDAAFPQARTAAALSPGRMSAAAVPGAARRAALVVLVPAADAAAGALRRAHDPAAARGVPAHVTLLYPLDAGVAGSGAARAAVAAVCGATSPFRAEFADIGRFPGVVWLAPRDAGPFLALTRAFMACFPGVLPYGGAFEPVPHLTVGDKVRGGVCVCVWGGGLTGHPRT